MYITRSRDDIPVLIQIFHNEKYFDSFINEYISVLKKIRKKVPGRWKRLSAWTCIYMLGEEHDNTIANAIYRFMYKYLKGCSVDEISEIKDLIEDKIEEDQYKDFFESLMKKEGFSQKIGNFFHKR